MRIDSYVYTNKGKYEINEDSTYCKKGVYAVCDGLGGKDFGEKASKCAIDCLAKNSRHIDSDEKIQKLILLLNENVIAQGNKACTTIAVGFICKNVFRYSNIGDSRVYYFRDGKFISRTRDHSVCQVAVELGNLEESEIRGNEDRSKLLKVLGDDKDLKVGKPYKPVEMQKGDAFLICSDGFWEYVYENEMEKSLENVKSAKEWTEKMVDFHLKRSSADCDNFSAVCGIYL